MSNEVSRIVGVSGYSDGAEVMIPVLEVASDELNIEEYESFTYSNVMKDPRDFEKAAKGAVILGHSAAIRPMNEELDAKAYVAFNAPEPTPIAVLVGRAAKKIGNYARQLRSPDEQQRQFAAQRLRAGREEFGRHPWRNLRTLPEISRFSSLDRLSRIKLALPSVAVRAVVSLEDELFPLPPAWKIQKAQKAGVKVNVIDGTHDELYRDPDGVVRDALANLRIN